jgi:defect-in-organelle-trafficking protein DotC
MKERLLILLAFVITLQIGCSSSTKKPVEFSQIEALKSSTAPNTNINGIRLSGLKQTARGLGAQGGLAWRSRHLNELLDSQKRNLDHIFNFNYLILNQNVLPPVLVEGKNTLNLADEFTIRASDQDYQITQPPRFITAPPNWRNYIWMGYKKPEIPNSTLLPQSPDERKIWNKYIQIGWNEGVAQADQIFSANLARLQRDYEGMILYRKLLAQKMLTPPYVSKANLGVTGGGNEIRINDRVLRITSIPQLDANTKNWRPVISKKKQKPNPWLRSHIKGGKEKIN